MTFSELLGEFIQLFNVGINGYDLTSLERESIVKEKLLYLEKTLPQVEKCEYPLKNVKQVYLTENGKKMRNFCEIEKSKFIKRLKEKEAHYIIKSFS